MGPERSSTLTADGVRIEQVRTAVFTVPWEETESDGTLEWDSTTMITVEVEVGAERGLGYTYGDGSTAAFIESKLAGVVEGSDPMRPPATWAEMQRQIRNAGRPGLGALAVSAVDIALWDLKARLLGIPLADLLPRFHQRVPIYGSGGLTSYSRVRLAEELDTWVNELGIPRVKIKTARNPDEDPARLRLARKTIGDQAELFVDANGAFSRKQALEWARRYHEDYGVIYFEEPLTSEDREGLRWLREQGPPGIDVAAGEYEWDIPQLGELSGCVDILQADVTRVGGITNMLRADGIARARNLPFSAHCAPAISAHVCCAMQSVRHIEYFRDHVDCERLLLDGTRDPVDGCLEPDPDAPGHGLTISDRAGEYREQ